MSNRKTIIDDLVEDLKNYFNVDNGYNQDIHDIYRGYFQYDDIKQVPSIALTIATDEPYVGIFGEEEIGFRKMNVICYGYTKSDNGDISGIHNLLNDFINFIHNKNHFRNYKLLVENIGTVTLYEGAVTDPANIFELNFNLIYKS